MAEGIILYFAKSVVGKIASFTGDLVISSVTQEIKAAKSFKKDLKIIADKLDAIHAVLADAEERQYANNKIKVWLRDLRSIIYDIDDLLDEFAYDALQRRVNEGHLGRKLRYYLSSSNPLISRFDWSHKVNILHVRLDNIVAKKNDYNLTESPVEISSHEIRDPLDTSPYVHEPTIVGRDAAKHDILNKVLSFSDASKDLCILPIVGMGGIGKTALAKLVYKDVLDFDVKLWACVSDKFQLQKIVEDIVKHGTGEKNLSSQDLDTLVKRLHSLLDGRKYFLVLDDVWEDDIAKWSELKNLLTIGKAGSIILITTRSDRVASVIGTVMTYNLDSLPNEVCWTIFKQLAFAEGEEERYKELVKIGRLIVEKCKGIPLVVKSLGSLLRSERNEQQWKKINNMDSFVGLHGQYEKKVMALLKLSYDKLPSHLKPCFAHLSLFVKDFDLLSDDLISYWSALGLLQLTNGEAEIEDRGYSYFLELISRSLLQEPDLEANNVYASQCKMHDMMHDLATNILEEELCIATLDKMKVSPFTRHLIWECEGSNSLKETTFLKELCNNTANIRSFRTDYKMNGVISTSFLEGIISKFIYLRILDLFCIQMEELPKTIGNLKHLRYLSLQINCAIRSLPNSICKLLNLDSLNLLECEQLKKLPDDIYLLQSLRTLTLTTCQVSLGTKFNELNSLRFLRFGDCKRLTSLWDGSNVGRLTSLRCLAIQDCPKLTSLPKSMKSLTFLETLDIDYCEMLDLEKGESLQGLQSLRQLILTGLPKLERLPNGIQSAAASLQDLSIKECRGLVELPEWLQCFTSLHRVWIVNCPYIMTLPRCFCHLNSMQQLYINGCPPLSERCAVPYGEDYSLIQHIPEFILDDVTYPPTPKSIKTGLPFYSQH